MEIHVYPPGGNSGFRNEFHWMAVNIKPFHYTVVHFQWSLKNSSTVNQRKLMHSADLVSSSLQTQFEYPRQQQSEKMHYTFMLPLVSLPWMGCSSSVSQSRTTGDVCSSQHQNKKRNRQIWYTGNRTGLIPLDVRHLSDQLAHKRSQSAPSLLSHYTALQCFMHFQVLWHWCC